MLDFTLYGPGQHAELAARLAECPQLRASPERRNYLVEFVRHGPDGFMFNGRGTRACVAICGNVVVPLVVNDGDVDDCYLVSPRAHYVLYMDLEARKIKPRWLSLALRTLLAIVGAVATAGGFNRHVSINNWLFTTSPLNPISADELRALTAALKTAFPTHALVFRGVDPRNSEESRSLLDCGYRLIMNRPVHEWDPARLPQLRYNARRNFRIDAELFSESGPLQACEQVQLSGAEAELVARQYEDLYINKHSKLNAHFTAAYFERSVAAGLAKITLFRRRDTEEMAGFGTWFDDPDRVVASLVGYDRQLSKHDYPVYRASWGFMAHLAVRLGVKLFLSTGAASFKLNRGSYEWMEYEAFYVDHLRLHRRFAWRLLASLINFGGARLDSTQI